MDNLRFDQTAYSEYMDDYNYSQGFYITPPGDGSVLLGGIRTVGENSDERYRRAESAAKFAVEEHNKKQQRMLKFVRILNLNREPAAGAIYYITLVAADASGETCHYHLKVWEKLNTGYQVLMFRLAPYWVKSSDKLGNNVCCVGIDNLMPWMDESYVYYKCFYRASNELLGVEIIQNGEKGDSSKGKLWFKNHAESEKMVKKYKGKMMPHSNIFYNFDLRTCPSTFHF
ncbi:hypothetical protein ACS0TY_014672 [Phlomoides rotata]